MSEKMDTKALLTLGAITSMAEVREINATTISTTETIELSISVLREYCKALREVRMAIVNECNMCAAAIKELDKVICGENGKRFTVDGLVTIDTISKLSDLMDNPKTKKLLTMLTEK